MTIAHVDQVLEVLASEIEPTPTMRAEAAASQRNLRQKLEADGFGNRVTDSFLMGSYSRNTAIYPLDDVDIIVEIDPTKWDVPWLRLDGRPAPKMILKSFAGAIRRRYDNSVFVQRRSVRIELSHISLDVVPAIGGHDDPEMLFIPDSDEDCWIETGPKKHSRLAKEINARSGGHFKPIVKFAKWWNSNLAKTTRLKSFAVETAAARVFLNTPCDSVANGLFTFFDFLCTFCGASTMRWRSKFDIELGDWGDSNIPDLAGTGSNLVASLEEEARVRFLKKAVLARDRLLAAIQGRDYQAEERVRALLSI